MADDQNTSQQEQPGMSTASYRGFEIIETATGCMFEFGEKQYKFTDFGEATACIDFIYVDAARRVLAS